VDVADVDHFFATSSAGLMASASGAGALSLGDFMAAALASWMPSSLSSSPAVTPMSGGTTPTDVDVADVDHFFATSSAGKQSAAFAPVARSVFGPEDGWIDAFQQDNPLADVLRPALSGR
jgi:hypothetical protein